MFFLPSSYQAGDHVGIYPCNDWLMVERLGRALRVDLDTVVSFHSLDAFNSKEIFPKLLPVVMFIALIATFLIGSPCSYRTAFRHFVDINGGPTPHHLRVFAEYAEGNDRERLLFLSSEAVLKRNLAPFNIFRTFIRP
jgi:NADPH-ferrihemoprotein reductase